MLTAIENPGGTVTINRADGTRFGTFPRTHRLSRWLLMWPS